MSPGPFLNSILERTQATWIRSWFKSPKSITPRKTARADPAQSSLLCLPYGIVFQIFYLLQDVSPKSLIRLGSSCSQFTVSLGTCNIGIYPYELMRQVHTTVLPISQRTVSWPLSAGWVLAVSAPLMLKRPTKFFRSWPTSCQV
jgi:hypothetical protein